MATFRSKHTNQEIENILDRAKVVSDKPFYLYYDKTDKKYRFFTTAEKRDAWVTARDTDTMTEEINSYQFTDAFDAPAPSVIQISGLTEVRSERCDANGNVSGVNIEYAFATIEESTQSRIPESVSVIYTIETPLGINTVSMIYLADTTSPNTSVSFNADKYLAVGKNTVSMLIKGRTTGTSKLSTVSINVFELSIESDFQINKAISPRSDFTVPVKVKGDGSKTLNIYIDGTQVATRQISEMESGTLITPVVKNTNGLYGIGKHTLQLQASCNDKYTDILYFEFVISGRIANSDGTYSEQKQILIKTVIPQEEGVIQGEAPTIRAEQYVLKEIEYAFYSSDSANEYKVAIQWEITNSDMQIQPIDMDAVDEAKVGTVRTLSLIPMEASGTTSFNLRAKMKGTRDTTYTVISNSTYPFIVSPNSNISETTTGMTMKLNGTGRSNNEPSDTRATWTYVKNSEDGNYNWSTTFSNNFQWSGDYGWTGNTLSVKGGTWCRINNKPFSSEIAPQNNNGVAFEIEFMTIDVDDDDSVVLSIGNPAANGGAAFYICGSKAVLRSNSNREFVTRFKSNEVVKMSFVIYPSESGKSSYPRMVFIQVNGILSFCQQYDYSDIFNIGSSAATQDTNGMINIGGTNCNAGIKIYSIRTYNKYIDMYEELNNYIIDRNAIITDPLDDDSMVSKIADNDVYTNRVIDVSKLSGQITVVQMEGDLQPIIDAKSKEEVEVALSVVCPTNPSINITSPHTKITNAGQSTLGMPVPSMHVKLGAYETNKVLDADGKALVGNRWAFIDGTVPEKKFRLQANYMDSSGCHNGAFLKLWNTVAKKVKIGEKYVLLPPGMRSVMDTSANGYAARMKAKWGENPNSTDGEWSFPYTMNMVPDSIPCVVVWKKPNETSYRFLGQYVIMDEKKADFASAKRTIYFNKDTNGIPDPFTFKTSKTKDASNILWDNSATRQFEIVNNVGSLTYFNSISGWNEISESGSYRHETDFEMIYPDPDDVKEEEGAAAVEAIWTEFRTQFVEPVCNTFGNQTEFNKLYCDGADQIFDRWAWAAYYSLALRNCCVDSMVRNMQIMTFGEKTASNKTLWLPKWWDVDMQCGLLQSGAIGAQPRSDRTTLINGVYLFAGKNAEDGTSSWLWDALENCPQFQQDVKTMDGLLYDNGWKYTNLTDLQDNFFVKEWNESLFNESGLVKYVDIYNTDGGGTPVRTTAYTFMLQGDRTPHRHWFLKSNYGYLDALHCCGDYANLVLKFTPMNAKAGTHFYLYPSEDFYFGVLHNDTDQLYSGVYGKRGELVKVNGEALKLSTDIGSKDTITIYAINKLEKINLSEFGKYLNGTVDFEKTKDPVLGTVLKELVLGTNNISDINNQAAAESANGNSMNEKVVTLAAISTMSRLEKFNIRGLLTVTSLGDSTDSPEFSSQMLTHLYAAGSGLKSFYPKAGSKLQFLELPTTVSEIIMDNCEMPLTIDWYNNCESTRTRLDPTTGTQTTEKVYYVQSNNGNPTTSLKTLKFTSMGSDAGAKALILRWLHVIRDSVDTTGKTAAQIDAELNAAFADKQLTFSDCTWYNIAYDDLLLIARIPQAARNLNGSYLVCSTKLSSEQMNNLMVKFGDYIFTDNSLLMIDCDSDEVKITVTGDELTVTEEASSSIIEITQGNVYNFSGIVFPVKPPAGSDNSRTFMWYLGLKNDRGLYETKNPTVQNRIISSVRPIRLNADSGSLSAEECSIAAISGDLLKIQVNVDAAGGMKHGEAFLRVNRRTYPTQVRIDAPEGLDVLNDEVQITESGSYTFNAVHYNPSNYTGNLSSSNGGVWSLAGFSSRYLTETKTNTSYELTVDSNFQDYVSEETGFILNYTSNWKDDEKSCSTSLNLTLISVIQEVLGVQGNPNTALYYCLENKNGFYHTGGGNRVYTSLDLKYGYGVLNFRQLIEEAASKGIYVNDFTTMKTTNSHVVTYNVAKYMKNVKALNLSGCEYFSDELDVLGMTNLTSINMYGTATGANVKIGYNSWLSNITYGTPTYIEINTPKYLGYATISVEDTSLIKDLTLLKLNGGKEMSTFMGLLNHDSTSATTPLPSLTSVKIQTNNKSINDYLGDTGQPLEDIRNFINTHALSTDSYMNSAIKMHRLYPDSRTAVMNTFSTLSITSDEVYRRWNDPTFEDCISLSANNFGGDNVGITTEQVKSYNGVPIRSLGTAIKGNTAIRDLSDLYYFENLAMPGHAGDADSDFCDCINIHSVSIPKNVVNIGQNTFTNKPSLSSIDFTHAVSLTSIDSGGFATCTNSSIEMRFGADMNNPETEDTICDDLAFADMLGMPNLKMLIINDHSDFKTLVI